MKVINIHSRILNCSIKELTGLLETLATKNDKIWPKEKWPEMKFKSGIKVGSKGGHGPIRYSVEKYNPKELIQFKFYKPYGFIGIHKFEITELNKNKAEIKHTIDMNVKGKGILIWTFVIHSLHNALIEDGFDKIENELSEGGKITQWNFWTKFLIKQISKKKK